MAEKPLAARVLDTLIRDKRTKRIPVDVTAIGAQITLTGTVPTAKDKLLVEEVARSVAGVAGVINEIRVGRTG